jgi:PAS domain S-box-containing protein
MDRPRTEEPARAAAPDPLHALIDNIPAFVAIHDESGKLELENRAAREYHGRNLAVMEEWRTGDVVHPDDLPALLVAQQRAVTTGEPLELEQRLRRADGAYRWFHIRSVRSSPDQGRVRWFTVGTDIHDRRTAEDALRRSQTFLLEVQRLTRSGGWRYDLQTDSVESSPEIQRSYAVQPGEDISRPAFWFDRIHPDDRPRVQPLFERCLRDRTDYRAGYRIVLPDGSIGYHHATGHPVTNAAGELVEFIGASMEMTEHWLAATDLERAGQAVRDLQTKLSRAAQIATVGELAGSIAHEVNQPLAAVVANAHACLRWLSHSPPNVANALKAAERIAKDGKDAGEVVRRVRALFKKAVVEKAPLDLNEVVREVLGLLDGYPIRRHVAIATVLDADLPQLPADRVQLQQLVLNLVLNALESMQPVSGRARQLTVRTSRAQGGAAVLQVADNGIGLDDADAAFEPFVTTKPDGMGMGLAICRSIVAAHGGRLSAERNVDVGTTFTVTLPLKPDRSP